MSETVVFVAGFKNSDSTQQLILPVSTKSVTNGKTHLVLPDLAARVPENGSPTNGNSYHDSSEGSFLYNNTIPPTEGNNAQLDVPVQTTLQELEEQEEYCDDEILPCGLGKWFSPAWLQPLASKQMFLAIYCLTCVLQGMYYTYFVSVLTTIEKLFQIKSKTTGIIMSATEIGQIGGSLLLTYYGGHGHRPKWIGWGMVLFGLSSLICSLPHFLFGTIQAETPIHFAENKLVCKSHNDSSQFWARNQTTGDMNLGNLSEMTTQSPPWSQEGECGDVGKQQSQSRTTQIALSVFFVSLVGIGLGQTAVYTLGMTYIDDNVANRESPTYFAITIGVRILGPVFGFLLGAACTSLYVDPFADVNITTNDPGWIGAWWLGMVLVSVLIFISSLAMFSFPRRLPNPNCREEGTVASIAHRRQELSPKRNPSLKDFPKAVRRLLKNDILLLRTASSVLHILPIAGLYTFLPKYLESQFRLTANVANMISAMGGILVMGVGISLSGVFIRKMKPNPKFVAGWLASAALLYSIGMGILMLIGCPMNDFAGLSEDGKVLNPPCNRTCECDPHTFAPICSEGFTYFSACHAGCAHIHTKDFKYSECECLGTDAIATTGYCPRECTNFMWYIGLFSLFVLIHSTSEVGSLLLTLRCVDPKDKAMALGLIQFAIGLFGNVPCPIIYGAVVDSACLVWKITCGEQGACSLYESTRFRYFFHGTTGGLMLLAFLVDVVVWYKADKISFTSGDCSETVEEELQPMRVDSGPKNDSLIR